MGANVAGVKSILLRPSDPETSVSFRVRRRLEEPIRRKMERRQAEREKTDRSGKA
jgi:predicted HAD superfamily phosphohydrolase YqeG